MAAFFARGIGDNKGQHFALLLTIESYLAVHGDLPCNFIFLLEGEEEIGSPQIADFVRQHAERLKADLVVTSDGPLHESGLRVVTFGVRGVASFELRPMTASRDVHSGNFGGIVPLLYPTVGGSLPDYAFTKILGIPSFVMPYAKADETNHAPNENLEIVRFIDGIRTGAALLSRLGKLTR